MIFENITREDYNKLEGVNASKLKGYYESALNGNYEQNKPRVESEAMAFGTAAHSLVLEPHLFGELYGKMPAEPTKEDGSKINKNTKIYKEWKANLPTDRKYLSSEQWQLLTNIQNNIENYESASKILKACPKRETAVTWEMNGIKCKALIDFMGDKIVGDLKTTRSIPVKSDIEATQKAIFWDLVSTRNLLQFAYYLDGCKANGLSVEKFAVIFAKNNGSCDIATALLSESTIEFGQKMYEQAIENWKERESNIGAFAELMEV